MGVSTYAILVYGIPLADDAIKPYDDTEDNEDESSPSYMVFMGKVIDGVHIVTHCSDEYRMHIATIAGTQQRARRGNPRAIDQASLAVDPSWNDRLQAFIEKHGLETDGDPGWYLASWWG